MKQSLLVKIFLAALFTRALYVILVPAVYFNVDTEGYYNMGTNFLTHPSLASFVTPYRTPLYGLFLHLGAPIVVAIQMLAGAITFTLFCHIISRFLPKKIFPFYCLFFLFDVLIIGWEHTLMTEGLAISLSLGITTVLLHILLAPTGKKFVLLGFLFTLGVLLRPSFSVFPLATLPIIAWYFRKSARVVFWACATIAAASLISLLYARANYKNYGYLGMQFGGDIVTLGRILEFEIPVESAKKYTYFYTAVTNMRATDKLTNPFRFLDYYDFAVYGKPYRFVELQAFNRTVILHNLPLYITKALSTIPEILLEVCEFIRVPAPSVIGLLQRVYGSAQYATLAVPFLWTLAAVLFCMKPTRANTLTALIGSIATSQIVLTALVLFKDIGQQYGRVLSVVSPHMYLFLLLCAITCVNLFRNHRI